MNSEYPSSRRIKLNSLDRLDISLVQREGLLKHSGSTKIAFRDNSEFNLVSYAGNFLDLSYLNKTANCQNNKSIRIDLRITPCNLGGSRYWFLCPGNNGNCKKRVKILYKVGLDFGCRHCFNLFYESQASGKTKLYAITKWHKMREKIEALEAQIKRERYKGYPTKKRKKMDRLMSSYLKVEKVAQTWLCKKEAKEEKLRRKKRLFL
jgi:hypothetical protein